MLFGYETDREFINLTPTEGALHSVVLQTGTEYTQTFSTQRASLSRVGLYLKPRTEALPNDAVTFTLRRQGEVVAIEQVFTPFIDHEGVTQLRLSMPITSTQGETLSLSVTVPPTLHEKMQIQLREPDATFDSRTVAFYIDGTLQAEPLAYQAYYLYQPTFGKALALLFIVTGLLLLLGPWLRALHIEIVYVGLLSVFVSLPAIPHDRWSGWLVLATAIAASGMLAYLRAERLSVPSRLLGSHIFALTTWFTLQYFAERPVLLMVAALPWLAWWFTRRGHTWGVLISALIMIAIVSGGILLQPLETLFPESLVAHWKDILLDPNQYATSQKVVGHDITWDHFGSYIGFINLLLALIGIGSRGRRFWPMVLVGIVGVSALLPILATVASALLPLPAAYLIIFAVFGMSFFAAWGLEDLGRYIRSSTLSLILTRTLLVLSLLDVLYVLSQLLEFNYL
ncbi:MAG: hypothetical protein WD972_03240 [Candidatus Andersenbacteria bacterium]